MSKKPDLTLNVTRTGVKYGMFGKMLLNFSSLLTNIQVKSVWTSLPREKTPERQAMERNKIQIPK